MREVFTCSRCGKTHISECDDVVMLRQHLATVTAERDELASDIVRLKAHLEAAERAAKANGEEAKAANERAVDWACRCGVAQSDLEKRVDQLSNLLAVVHRDGGHYENEHGTEKAVRDAMTIAGNLALRAERSEARAKVMRAALERIYGAEFTGSPSNMQRIALRAVTEADALKEATND